jgi:type I restriction enzyme R subunit
MELNWKSRRIIASAFYFWITPQKALVNLNPVWVKESRKYVMRIIGDEQEGKAELDNIINSEERYPVIATTSKLMTTGVDA